MKRVICPNVKECEEKIGGGCDHSDPHSADIFRCDKYRCSMGIDMGFEHCSCVPVDEQSD